MLLFGLKSFTLEVMEVSVENEKEVRPWLPSHLHKSDQLLCDVGMITRLSDLISDKFLLSEKEASGLFEDPTSTMSDAY